MLSYKKEPVATSYAKYALKIDLEWQIKTIAASFSAALNRNSPSTFGGVLPLRLPVLMHFMVVWLL